MSKFGASPTVGTSGVSIPSSPARRSSRSIGGRSRARDSTSQLYRTLAQSLYGALSKLPGFDLIPKLDGKIKAERLKRETAAGIDLHWVENWEPVGSVVRVIRLGWGTSTQKSKLA